MSYPRYGGYGMGRDYLSGERHLMFEMFVKIQCQVIEADFEAQVTVDMLEWDSLILISTSNQP